MAEPVVLVVREIQPEAVAIRVLLGQEVVQALEVNEEIQRPAVDRSAVHQLQDRLALFGPMVVLELQPEPQPAVQRLLEVLAVSRQLQV